MKQRTEQQPDAATRPTQLPFFNRQTNAQAVVQTKLTVGSSNDAHEQEANKTADMVMRKPENSAQNGAYTEGSNFSPTITPMVQRACAHCENEKEQTAQRKETGAATGGFAAPPSVANAISRSGSALDGNAKTFMESRFNRSFDNVQVHTDGESAASARDISARAYTSGNHIVFGEGQYQPNSDSGRHLLAHELTHVVQQGGGLTSGSIQRVVSKVDCDATNIAEINSAIPVAQTMINRAITALGGTQTPATVALLDNYFRSHDVHTRLHAMMSFLNILRGLRSNFTIECEAPQNSTCDGNNAYVYTFLSIAGNLHLCPGAFGRSTNDLAETIIHEASHKFDNTDDEAYCWSGCPTTLSNDDALDNADSFSKFARDI
jgi:Domain of unknown function (DUF4157)/Lysine-specific metallo-endopeptidase